MCSFRIAVSVLIFLAGPSLALANSIENCTGKNEGFEKADCFLNSELTDEYFDYVRSYYAEVKEEGRYGDTLQIEEFKFIVRKFNLITVDSEILQSTEERQSFVFGYNTDIVGERLILGVDIGFEDFESFSGYEMYIDQARGEDELLDLDFYDEPENYSIIAIGTFNRDSFFFTSTQSFDKLFEFDDTVMLDDNNETLWINTLLDVGDLFIDAEEDILLNPLNEEQHDEIITRFQNHLTIEATAASHFH